jgi:hypothetical protein
MECEKTGVKETSRRKTLRIATRNSLKPRRLPNETPRGSAMQFSGSRIVDGNKRKKAAAMLMGMVAASQ